MPKIWKIKAWFHSKVSKILGLAMLAGLVFLIYLVLTNAGGLWDHISGLFGFRQ